jgi:hypothetical protein
MYSVYIISQIIYLQNLVLRFPVCVSVGSAAFVTLRQDITRFAPQILSSEDKKEIRQSGVMKTAEMTAQ